MIGGRRAIARLAAGAAAALLVGCSGGGRTAALEVAVREVDSWRPVADAEVVVTGYSATDPSTGRPFSGALATGIEVLRPGTVARSGSAPTTGRTGTFGLLVIDAPARAPFDVVVRSPFEPVRRAMFDARDHPAVTGRPTEWRPAVAVDESDETAVEVQLRPATTAGR